MKNTSDTFTKESGLQLNKWFLIVLPLVLVAVTFLLYYPSLSYAFEFDDLASIEKLFAIRHTTLKSIFFQNSRWISYWLNALYYSWLPQSAKLNPFLYRLGNVVFHCMTGVLIFSFVKLASMHATRNRFFQYYGTFIAFITAGLFLLHPVQTQTVSYVIQGQLEGLACFFTMAILNCFLGLSLVKGKGARYFLMGLLFLLAVIACGSKEIIIVCPFLVLLVDWFFVAQGEWRSLKQRRWLHLLLFVIIITLYIYLLKPQFFLNVLSLNSSLPNNIGNVLTEHKHQNITPYYFCISQFKVILHYVWIFIWPFGMSVDYDWRLSRHFLAPDCLVPFVVLLFFGIYLLRRLRRNNLDLISFGFLWFFITVAPRSSFIPSTELLADYKTYIPSVGLFFVAAWLLVHAWIWLRERTLKGLSHAVFATLVVAVTAGLLVLVAWGAYIRNKVWSSPEAFWANVIQNAPEKARAYNNYGVYLCEGGKNKEAIEYFKKAIQLDQFYADPLNNIAVSYSQTGQIDLAIEALKHSLRLMPYHPEIYNNLANLYMQKNDHAHIEELLYTALKIRPHYGKAYYNLGNYYVKIQDWDKALQAYKDACTKADFDNPTGFGSYGKLCFVLKKYDEALWAFSQLLAVQPNSLEARFHLAEVYLAMGKFDLAEKLFKELIAQDPNNAGLRFQLAQALEKQGNYDEAVEQYEMVKKMHPGYAPTYQPLAYALAKGGRKAEAVALLRYFIQENPPEELRHKAQALLNALESGKAF